MRFYRIDDGHSQMYRGTLADAHRRARNREPEVMPPLGDTPEPTINTRFVEIHEIEVPTDKVGVLALLNSNPADLNYKVLRKWDLTVRGGLHETTNEKEF